MNIQTAQSTMTSGIDQIKLNTNIHSQQFTSANMLHFDPIKQYNIHQNDVIRFPTEQRITHKRWICNISQDFRFTENKANFLQVLPSAKHSQFSLLCKLLRLAHCDIIYFDCNFSKRELLTIRRLQKTSGTELVNSKQAFLLSLNSFSKLA